MNRQQYIRNIFSKRENKKYEAKDLFFIIKELFCAYGFQSVLVILSIVFIIYVVQYFRVFNSGVLSTDINDFGGFGSYLSGIGSIFSVFSLVFLIWTYRKDREEKKYSDEESMLFRYFDYMTIVKNNIRIAGESEIQKILNNIVKIIYTVPERIPKYKKKSIEFAKYLKKQSILLNNAIVFAPLSRVYLITIKYIFYESKYLSKSKSFIFLMSLLSINETIFIMFNLSRTEELNEYLLEQLFVYNENMEDIISQCKKAESFYLNQIQDVSN